MAAVAHARRKLVWPKSVRAACNSSTRPSLPPLRAALAPEPRQLVEVMPKLGLEVRVALDDAVEIHMVPLDCVDLLESECAATRCTKPNRAGPGVGSSVYPSLTLQSVARTAEAEVDHR